MRGQKKPLSPTFTGTRNVETSSEKKGSKGSLIPPFSGIFANPTGRGRKAPIAGIADGRNAGINLEKKRGAKPP
jgi:hypothetical protein